MRGYWLPFASISSLTSNPACVTICSKDYVIWKSKTEHWSILPDSCPHRLAPLSQGRVTENGIECPYHGWTFSTDGMLKKIPQCKTSNKCQNIKTSKIETMINGDILWGFLENDRGNSIIETVPWNSKNKLYVRDVPYSWNMLMENFFDPSHVPFAHHGLQGTRNDATHIKTKLLKYDRNELSLKFEDKMRGKKRQGIMVLYQPSLYEYYVKNKHGNMKRQLSVLATPTKNGWTRVYIDFNNIGRFFPLWILHLFASLFLHTDIWLHKIERTASQKEILVPDDNTVKQYRKWWNDYQWWTEHFKYVPNVWDKEEHTLFWKDHFVHHIQHCKQCKRTIRNFFIFFTLVFAKTLLF